MQATVTERKRVRRILFLARFAPLSDSDVPNLDAVWGSSPFYHSRLLQALRTTGVDIVPSRNPLDVVQNSGGCDFVYSIFNRASFRNSEIFVSSLCEFAGIPYLGGPPNVRAIAEDKHLAKTLARRLSIPTPDWTTIEPWHAADDVSFPSFPCIIKWRFGADSAHMTPQCVVSTKAQAVQTVRKLQQEGIAVIVEAFVPGLNLTTGVIGGDECSIFDTVQIDTDEAHNIQTYEQKKFGTGKRVKSIYGPNRVSEHINEYIRTFYRELSKLDYVRFDFRYDPGREELFFLECNAVCNLAPESSFSLSCKKKISDYDQLVRKILDVSLNRQSLFIK